MNNLQIFNHDEFGKVRVVEINNEPWLVGKDVCQAFGDTNHNRSLGRLDEADKQVTELVDKLGRKQSATIINESGLYSLLFAMQPQKANHDGVQGAYPIEVQERIEKLHKFKRWITHDVIPAIRKDGVYATPQAAEKLLSDPEFAIKIFTALKEEKAKRAEAETRLVEVQATCDCQAQQIAEFQPIKEYMDVILASEDMLTASQIAADYGLSAKALNKILHEAHLIHNVNGQWLLYSKQMNKGYTKSNTITVPREDGSSKVILHTMWTQKGRLRIHEILTSLGHKANMDKVGEGNA